MFFGRYSKFIRSPIRLRRELENSVLTGPLEANSNGDYGNIQRPEPKLPANQLRDDQNRYHTGFLVGVEDDDDQQDYQKRKREVEINIKVGLKLQELNTDLTTRPTKLIKIKD